MDNLLELADRCEAAEADDQAALLEEAFRLIDPAPGRMYAKGTQLTQSHTAWGERYDLFTDKLACDASLDAAMTLVPEGWRMAGMSEKMNGSGWYAHIATRSHDEIGHAEGRADSGPLALCAAALRARAAGEA